MAGTISKEFMTSPISSGRQDSTRSISRR